MREYSIPALADIPESVNLADVTARRAAEQPQAVALRRADAQGQWQDVTTVQFRDEVYALAKGLIAAGVGPGDRVALMSHTRYEWTLADYAIWTAGAVVVPIYETSSAEQAEWILSDSGAHAMFVEDEHFEQLINDLRDRVPGLKQIWRFSPGIADLAAAGDGVPDATVAERARLAAASDVATIIYTSGTTGRPKGCEITHRNLLADVRNAFLGPLTRVYDFPDPCTLLFLPLAHVFARIIEVGCLESGIVLGHSPNIGNLLPDLASFRPTFILAVPRVFEKVFNGAEQKADAERKGAIFRRATKVAIAWSEALDETGHGSPGLALRVQHAVFDRLVYARLRAALGGKAAFAVSRGAALAPRLGHFFRGIGVPVIEGYGLTETTAAVTANHADRMKIGTVGLPLPGLTVKIADDGEILVSGETIFRGYRGNEAATAEVLSDGWFSTGDVGELDDEGFLTITGRKKEIIVTAGGKNVAPNILEDRMRSHSLIGQALVVGDGRPYVAALITLDPEALVLWKERHGKPAAATVAEVRDDPELVAEVQAAVDDANKAVSRPESVRRFRILEQDFTQEDGHLSVKLALRRNVLLKEFAADIDALYS